MALYGQPREHPWNLFASHCLQRKREILQGWRYLRHLPILCNTYFKLIFKSCCGKQPIANDESADIIQFGRWEFRDNIPVQVIAEGNPTSPELLDVIRCQCKAHGKKCLTEACGCHKQPLSCTTFCNCYDGEDCLNPLDTNRDIVPAAEEGPGTEDINNSLEDDSDDGLEQDIADGGDVAADELVSDYLDNVGVGIKIKPSTKEISSYICLSVRRKKIAVFPLTRPTLF